MSHNDPPITTNIYPRIPSTAMIDSKPKTPSRSSHRGCRPSSDPANGRNIIYVMNIPLEYLNDNIETEIQIKLKKTCRVDADSVKCYKDLGIGIINLANSDDTRHLLEEVEAIVLDKEKNVILQFVKDVTIDSFIIVKATDLMRVGINTIREAFINRYQVDETISLHPIGDKFPYIFRLKLNDIIEYDKVAKNPVVETANYSFKSYIGYDCSFLDDLPRKMETDQLVAIILSQSKSKMGIATDYCVQIHTQSNTAIILANSLKCKDWINADSLSIDGKAFPKRDKLSYRLIVQPVLSGFDARKIFNHALLREKVVDHKSIADCIIVEVDSAETYRKCLEIGAFKTDGLIVELKDHVTVDDPDSTDIDAKS